MAARRTDVGERLGEGSVAFVVEQTAPLKLKFRVPERYLAAVKVGQAVKATVDPYPDTEFEGTLSLVGGSVDAAARTFLAEAEFPNRDGRLRPGLFAHLLPVDLGVLELTAQSRQISEYTFKTFEAFTAATLIYIVITMTVIFLMRAIEKRVAVPGYIAQGGGH